MVRSTPSQQRYVHMLLEKMGFDNSGYREKYMLEFFRKHGTYFETKYFQDEEPEPIYHVADAISLLKEELKFKETGIWNTLHPKEINSLTATDYSQYAFCPVSFSIQKSFNVERSKAAKIGLYFHEKQLLSGPLNHAIGHKANPEFKNIFQKYPFDMIRECELVFSGHTENSQTCFHSDLGEVIGRPDYIFKDTKGKYFIVEEKTKYLSHASFREYNEIQLLCYLRINEYEISRGLLIYWLYDYYSDKPSIYDAKSKELVLNNASKGKLMNIETELIGLIDSGKQKLDLESINEHKCNACKVSIYCFHKSKRFNEFTLPYNKEHMKTN